MRYKVIKDTSHKYKGFEIIGTTYQSCGGWVLGGRHYVDGTLKRNYNLKKDGKYILNPNSIYEKLSEMKEEVDRLIEKYPKYK